jgi:hypothetical protein
MEQQMTTENDKLDIIIRQNEMIIRTLSEIRHFLAPPGYDDQPEEEDRSPEQDNEMTEMLLNLAEKFKHT